MQKTYDTKIGHSWSYPLYLILKSVTFFVWMTLCLFVSISNFAFADANLCGIMTFFIFVPNWNFVSGEAEGENE